MKTHQEGENLIADEAIAATRDTPDGKPGRLVPEDDPEAHELIAGRGGVIPPKKAEKYGLGKGKAKAEEAPEERDREVRPLDDDDDDEPQQKKRKIT